MGAGLLGVVVWRALLLYADFLWFDHLGFAAVFVRSLTCRLAGFLLGAGAGLLLLYANFRLSLRLDGPPAWAQNRPGVTHGGPVMWVLTGPLLLLASVFAGVSGAALWSPWLLAAHSQPWGSGDPVFGRDLAFYLQQLPFQIGLQRLLAGLAVTAWALLYLRYAELPVPGDADSSGDLTNLVPAARRHLSWLGAGVALLLGWGWWLARFNLLTGSRSAVVAGAGAVDVAVRLPFCGLLVGLSLLAAVLLLGNVRAASLRRLALVVVVYLLVVAAGYGGLALYRTLAVLPNESDAERPYIERSIAATREALGLAQVRVQPFELGAALAPEQLAAEREVLSTVPLWSPPEITEQLVGTETLRAYYNFLVADYDRYQVGGRRQQVAVVAREMQVDRLEQAAQNWVNRHLVYTHGYGLVMASAHDSGAAGEPVKLIRDIPPRTPPELPLTQPRIYYGEIPSDYALTGLRPGSTTQELDYPAGDRNVGTTYAGQGGVPLGGGLRRLAWAVRLRSLNVLISRLLQPGSRLHWRRAVLERLQTLAPFLDYDSEPYPVVVDGRIVWLVDAYTVSQRYPYAQTYPLAPAVTLSAVQVERETRQMVNYVRNSVKVTVDAYDGTVRFYAWDPHDPLLAAWARAFPTLFTRDPLPAALREHVRYPADLFALQARAYARYHMTAPEVFYNGEDLWDVAREETTVRTPQPDGSYHFEPRRERMAPYYALLRLPGEAQAQFRLILPFTPASNVEAATGRDNLIGWLAADCDPARYGQLTVFHFPKSTLVFGPLQVEALIDQDPEISQQLTLWSEQGSRVLRGRLLVIPVGNTLLYVEPLYLTAERRGALPELKRVVVFYNGVVRMADRLDRALELALSGDRETSGSVEALRLQQLGRQAAAAYSAAEAARQQGDLRTYGEKLNAVGRLLQEFGQAPAPAAAPGQAR
ncbi:MAG: UPF0182 family protein [Fimbriimonadaceae bacterium]|nr:UPF0182 family protein [Fimbriimonadaceae bacterium]